MSRRPWSQACENNKGPILAVLREVFRNVDQVLEIGSGTGQHARFFAEQLPHLRWQPSDLPEHLEGIELWRSDYGDANLLAPVPLDVTSEEWGVVVPAGVFTANTLHIMPWPAVCDLFGALGRAAPPGSRLCIYGPFNYGGGYTSPGNARFDEWLSATHPGGGIRDFEAVSELAAAAGYELLFDYAMPANNRCLVWERSALP
jgi:hypothetical protein